MMRKEGLFIVKNYSVDVKRRKEAPSVFLSNMFTKNTHQMAPKKKHFI